MANGLIPFKFQNQFQKSTYVLEKTEKLLLSLQITLSTPPSPAPSHSASHLLCAMRGWNNWRHGHCVCVFVCVWKRAQLRAPVRMCVFTCARSCKNASVLVAQGTASARFNSPLNATVTPVRLCVATYLHWRRYGKNLWTSKSRRLHGSSQLWPQ